MRLLELLELGQEAFLACHAGSSDRSKFGVQFTRLNRPAATSGTQTYKALVGAKPVHTPFCSQNGTVYACDFTQADGTAAELAWDAQYGRNGSQMSNPIICGSTNYSVPTQFSKGWADVASTTHPAIIGANPILLEAQAGQQPQAPDGLHATVVTN